MHGDSNWGVCVHEHVWVGSAGWARGKLPGENDFNREKGVRFRSWEGSPNRRSCINTPTCVKERLRKSKD